MNFQPGSTSGHRERSEGGLIRGVARGHRLDNNCASGIGHETLAGLQNHVSGCAGLGQPMRFIHKNARARLARRLDRSRSV